MGAIRVPVGSLYHLATPTMTRISVLFAFATFAALSTGMHAQSPVGRWITLDKKSGEAESVIVIEEQDGQLIGRVDSLINPEEPNPVCEKCRGDNKNRPIIGMQIISAMQEKKEGEWSGGRALDPENGKTYRCKFWLEEGHLRLRGYLGPFYRTETWIRFEDWISS